MQSPRGSSTYSIALDAKRAAAARDSIMGELYRALFEALLARLQPQPLTLSLTLTLTLTLALTPTLTLTLTLTLTRRYSHASTPW